LIQYMFLSIYSPELRLTRFPYTALFRSHQRVALVSGLSATLSEEPQLFGYSLKSVLFRLEKAIFLAVMDKLVMTARNMAFSSRKDRKSTRLNSSHVKNSYDELCFKKKKK